MSGTLPNLPLSTQWDKDTGLRMAGGQLACFAANTSTPQDYFSDTGLSISLGPVLTLDGAGRVPNFYLADGSVRIRLTNSAGVVQFDEQNLLVIGPSSGAGGGSSVDPNAIFKTGDGFWTDATGVRAGWVRDNGRTIGSATSGASERANADCESLFLFLWALLGSGVVSVVGGAGATAADDWAANKQITTPDKRGCVAVGADGMGNTAAGRFAGVPFVAGSADAVGSICGGNIHTLINTELPIITPTFTGNLVSGRQGSIALPPGFSGADPMSLGHASLQPLGGGTPVDALTVTGGPNTNINLPNFTPSGSISSFGGNSSHNNMPRGVIGTFYRKL